MVPAKGTRRMRRSPDTASRGRCLGGLEASGGFLGREGRSLGMTVEGWQRAEGRFLQSERGHPFSE